MAIRPGRYAAIDIGTVTCRMLVADVRPDGTLHELTKEYAICNLGEGVDATGRLSQDAVARVLGAIDRYVAIRDSWADADTPITTIAMATSAARDAENGAAFIEALAARGIVLSIIPGSREAGLSFLGAGSAFSGEGLLVVDVGGGSTEIAWGVGGQMPQRMHSFDVGCRRMTERFLLTDPPTADELACARNWTMSMMEPVVEAWRSAGMAPARLVAVAGTATSAVSMREAMAVYDSSKVHGARVGRADIAALEKRLAAMDLDRRSAVVGLDPGRAPVIVAGMVILGAVMDVARLDEFTVSEADILDGMLIAAASNI